MEIKNNFEIERAIGLGIAIGNTQPKHKYKTAYWHFVVMVLCFHFELNVMYPYNN